MHSMAFLLSGRKGFLVILLVLSVALNALAQIAMKLASQRELDFRQLFTNIPLYIAGILYGASLALWLKGLVNVPLSKAYPLQSMGYVLVFLLSYMILNEEILAMQFLGLLIICCGLVVIGFSK